MLNKLSLKRFQNPNGMAFKKFRKFILIFDAGICFFGKAQNSYSVNFMWKN